MRGWKLTSRWTWVEPSPEHMATEDEGNAIDYLIQEWDYGGVE
jgi:hypothetical protein